MESAANTHQFFLDGSADAIGINTSSPVYELDMSGSTDALRVPIGSTGQRPTGATGIIRFNSTTGQYEACQDGSTYVIAENFLNNAEFAGVNFAPDGKTLFVNIYSPTMTIAITGPWEELI